MRGRMHMEKYMKKRFKLLKTPELFKFTVSWFSMLLIPIVMGFSIYALVLNSNFEQLEVYNYQLVKSAAEDLERSLSAADDFADTLLMVKTLNDCMQLLPNLA